MVSKNFKISDTIIIVHDGVLKVVIVKGVSTSNAFSSGILLTCQVAYSSQQCVRLFDIAVDYEGNPINFEFIKVVSHFRWWTDMEMYCSTHYPEYCI